MAKFSICEFMGRDGVEVHKCVKRTRYIIWLSGKFFMRDTAGGPDRTR